MSASVPSTDPPIKNENEIERPAYLRLLSSPHRRNWLGRDLDAELDESSRRNRTFALIANLTSPVEVRSAMTGFSCLPLLVCA